MRACTAWMAAGLGLLLMSAAGASAQVIVVPGCVELEYSTSPVRVASGEKLVCVVVNDLEETIEVDIDHVDEDGDEVKEVTRTIPGDSFRRSTVMAPFGGTELYCEVEITVCSGTDVSALAGGLALANGGPLHGSLKRQDAANRDISESELVLREITIEDPK